MVVDGNSILNRAFYGIKILTTKDGFFTNAIQGFMNILLSKTNEIRPDCVAIAFDLKAPTFRHKMYDGYKANRKGMPDELSMQVPVLKELLIALGYKLVQQEGWEADDILGTLAAACPEDSECCIVTGDRDSLQLVSSKTKVYLTTTKMGRPATTVFDENKVNEVYGVTPKQLIDIKALMGDPSDNIPGAAGIGEKTAGELIKQYESIDNIYDKLDSLEIKPGVKKKLSDGESSVRLSYTLGTISTQAPIETSYTAYVPEKPNNYEAVKILTGLEMFKMIERLDLRSDNLVEGSVDNVKNTAFSCRECDDHDALLKLVRHAGQAAVTLEYVGDEIGSVYIGVSDDVVRLSAMSFEFFPTVTEIFEDDTVSKSTSELKETYAFALSHAIELKNVRFDAQLAGYVLDPSLKDYSCVSLAQRCGIAVPTNDDLPPKAVDCRLITLLEDVLGKELENKGQAKLLTEIELPLAQVLADMELTGFCVDRSGIADFGKRLEKEIDEIKEKTFELTETQFNINSTKQLGEILFEKLNLPYGKKTKTGWSTNADVLEKLAPDFPVVGLILDYRAKAKLHSTYCEGLLKCIAADGRIHSTLNQTETRTGRISSADPNLQNIPVRSELGREMRKFFVAGTGCVLADSDYSQIELRVLADAANDKSMIDAFNNGDDIHAITASQVFNMPLGMVTPLMRSRAKAVNFGIVYGIGAFSLAQDIGVTRKEADNYIRSYLEHYSGVDAYMKKCVEKARSDGFAETLFSRRRYLPELTSSNFQLRSFGERVARNMPIQGTAADIIKIAMIRVYERLKREKLKAKLIMQVHDELLIEAPEGEAQQVAGLLKEEMENAVKLKVKLTADVNCGKTWYEAKG